MAPACLPNWPRTQACTPRVLARDARAAQWAPMHQRKHAYKHGCVRARIARAAPEALRECGAR
eukprot:4643174-Alexandrium_andersonii.AAC.1